MCCSVLQCVAVAESCSVLQFVEAAMCCSVIVANDEFVNTFVGLMRNKSVAQ